MVQSTYYFQGRNRDVDIENGCADMGALRQVGGLGLTYIYTTMCNIDSGDILLSIGTSARCSVMT